MKKLSLLVVLFSLLSTSAWAQCSFTVNGSAPISICDIQLPGLLIGSPPGGVFAGVGTIPDGANYIFDPLAGVGNYDITYTAPDGCVSTVNIEVLTTDQTPVQNTSSAPNFPFFCENSPAINLTGNLGADAIFTVNDQIASSFDPAALGPGAHSVQYFYQDPNNGCTAVDLRIYNVMALPDMAIDGLPNTVCVDDPPLLLSGVGDFIGPGITGLATFDPTLAGVGTHTITHAYSDFSGVCVDTSYAQIEVTDVLQLDVRSFGSPCYTDIDTLVYYGDFPGISASFQWTIDEGTILSDLGDTLLVQWDSPGDKIVSLEVIDALCSAEPIDVMFTKVGVDVSTIDDLLIQQNDQIVLVSDGTNSLGEVVNNFSWTPPNGLSCIDCPSPNAEPTETTTYIVTGTDSNGCLATDSVTITVVADRGVFIPNAFTPNEDGSNDIFKVEGKGISAAAITIFDRWGEKVFQGDAISGWDGTFNSRPVNAGVFLYMVEVLFYDGASETIRGNVTAIR